MICKKSLYAHSKTGSLGIPVPSTSITTSPSFNQNWAIVAEPGPEDLSFRGTAPGKWALSWLKKDIMAALPWDPQAFFPVAPGMK